MYKEIGLESKRNHVIRIYDGDETFIRKEFKIMKRFSAEAGMLKVLNDEGIRVPKILEVGPDYLILEDLGDQTLLTWLEKAENENLDDYKGVIESLADFLKSFYRASERIFGETMLMYDMNFRNFIVHEDVIYRVDLEQATKGVIESDIGKLLAFSTTYDPPGTEWKMIFRDRLLEGLTEELNLDRELVLMEEADEFRAMESRRNK